MKFAYQGSSRERARALMLDSAFCPDSDSWATPVDAAVEAACHIEALLYRAVIIKVAMDCSIAT